MSEMTADMTLYMKFNMITDLTSQLTSGCDILGEPGNQVPMKSLVSSEVFDRNHAFLVNIQSEEIYSSNQQSHNIRKNSLTGNCCLWK